jgi:hypothetical protein
VFHTRSHEPIPGQIRAHQWTDLPSGSQSGILRLKSSRLQSSDAIFALGIRPAARSARASTPGKAAAEMLESPATNAVLTDYMAPHASDAHEGPN